MKPTFKIEDYIKNIWLPYTQMQDINLPPLATKAKGLYIYLEDGRKILDCTSSWWSVCHGYSNEYISYIASTQLETLSHVTFAGFANKPAYVLSKRLISIINSLLPKETSSILLMERCFFSDSGSTAIEVALKMCVQFHYNNQSPDKSKFLSFYNAYHGDTMGAMSLCSPDGMHSKFKHYMPQQIIAALPVTPHDFHIFEELIIKHKDQLAGVIIEPLIQCAGGMKFYSPEVLSKIYHILQKHHILLIVDECATGFYRTGSLFAFLEAKIVPDLLVIGKALTAGMTTLAATISSKKIFDSFLGNELDQALMHGPTFMGNALACAIANASLDLFQINPDEEYLINKSKNSGLYKIHDHHIYDHPIKNHEKQVQLIEKSLETYLRKLENHYNIKEIRVKGAIGVIEFHQLEWDVIKKMREMFLSRNIFLRPFSNVLYLMPPLIITNHDLEYVCNIIEDVIANIFN